MSPANAAIRTHGRPHEPWFTSGDVDGFFGLFFSGFPDLLLIVGLAPVCGFPVEFVTRQVLPGVAISILAGNLFYAWQARRLAARTGRDDVTAIPFGVNTPTIFAYVFLIMGPVYMRTHSGTLAWQAGVFASLISGVAQTAGAFCTDWLRRHTPRAALLCPLAGLALAYLCLGFIFGVFDQAAIALLPMLVLFSLYGSRLKLHGEFRPLCWRLPLARCWSLSSAICTCITRPRLRPLHPAFTCRTSQICGPSLAIVNGWATWPSSCRWPRWTRLHPFKSSRA